MADAVGYLIDFLFPITVNFENTSTGVFKFRGGRYHGERW
jgi:hypothetical protein